MTLLELYENIQAAERAFDARRQELIDEFLDFHTQTVTFPSDHQVYWQDLRVRVDLRTEKVTFDAPYTPDHRPAERQQLSAWKTVPAGRKFVVLKSWKTGKKVRLTHYAIYNPRTKQAAHVAF